MVDKLSAASSHEYIPAAQKGVEEAFNNGILGGYPVIGIKVAIVDGSYHEAD